MNSNQNPGFRIHKFGSSPAFSTRIILFFFLLQIQNIFANDQIPAKPQNHPIALVGGTIYTVSGEIISGGTILFDKGKIVAVGKNITLPAGTEQIDVTGKYVYPGMIAANTQLGLVEIEAVRATRDVTETGPINPNVVAAYAYNPDSEIIPTVRSNGVTLALSVPEGGLIAGTSSLMMLDGWTWEQATLKNRAGIHIYWPRMMIIRAWWMTLNEEEQKKSIDRNLKVLTDAFLEAKNYWIAKKSESKNTAYHKVDERWEAMIPVFDGKIPVFIHADEIKQIQAAVDFCSSEGVKMILVGGQDGWRMLDVLKSKNIPVIVSRVQELPMRTWEDYDGPYKLPAKLYEAGIPFCISDNGSWQQRNLPFQASTAAAYGLPRDEALKAVTLYPAQILGVADRVGSLEVGKDATLIVSTGDVLDMMSNNIEYEFIQGKKIDLNDRHKLLYHKYQEKYRLGK